MNDLYRTAGLSKQAHWAAQRRENHAVDLEFMCLSALHELRGLHPRMGLKKLYRLIEPEGIGRDKFMEIALRNGYGLSRKVSRQRTTFRCPWRRYSNLLIDRKLTDVNQVWTSDITYFRVQEQYYYLSFVLDVYSRRILGYQASDSLRTAGPLAALTMALKTRGISSYPNLVHHSDRGVQYTSQAYTDKLKEYEINISMCDSVYENSHIERVNGTIKNEYLHCWHIDTSKTLRSRLRTAVERYNSQRPHLSLQRMTPMAYEQTLEEMPEHERTTMKIYTTTTGQCSLQEQGQLKLF